MEQRTKYQAVLDCRYGFWFNDLNERLFRRLDTALTVSSLIAGGGAVVALTSQMPAWNAASGVMILIIAVLQAVARPGEAAFRHCQAKLDYAELDGQADGLDLGEFDARLKRLQGTAPTGLRSIGPIAYNANLRATGHSDRSMAEPRLSRLIDCVI